MSWVISWSRYMAIGAALIGLQVATSTQLVTLQRAVNSMSHVLMLLTAHVAHMTKIVHKAVARERGTHGYVTPPFLSLQLHSTLNCE